MSNEELIERLIEQNTQLISLLSHKLEPAERSEATEIINPRAITSGRWGYKKQKLEKLFGHEIIRHTSSTEEPSDNSESEEHSASSITEAVRTNGGSSTRVDYGERDS